MNPLFFLYTFGVMTVGFLFGASVITIINRGTIRQISEENKSLKRLVRFLKLKRRDTVEIIYPNRELEDPFKPF